jgi:hypothetical protein
MAGLGSYARGQGVYEVEDAQAQAINLDTMIKWNKALRARQRALREDQAKDDAKRNAEQAQRVDRADLESGATLNNLLAQIFDFDPGATKSTRAKATVGAASIREIPFEWDTEAITICIDQLTAQDSLPSALMDSNFAEERAALRGAVEAAIKEDTKSNISSGTQKRLNEAITKFRNKFTKVTPDFDPAYADSVAYFTTLASLSHLLSDPSMKRILAELENGRDRTVGDLIAFMQAYNLRFGPTTSDRQVQIYRGLVPLFARVLDDVDNNPASAAAPDKTGEQLRSAAKAAFKGMNWDALKAHARDQ